MTSSAFGLELYRTGNKQDSTATGTYAACLAGGGFDVDWAEGWKYLLSKANGGDVLIVRTDGRRGDYESWIYKDDDHLGFPQVNSVTTIVIDKKSDANSAVAVNAISKAAVVFFVGGDQSNYVDRLQDSKFLQTLNQRLQQQRVAVGGTSAGMAILGGVVFASHQDSPMGEGRMVTSEDVMKNPMGNFVDVEKALVSLPYLEQVITDTHFSQRNRQGRIVGLMARATQENLGVQANTVKGIASDEGTALCVDKTGIAHVYGIGNVFFLKGHGEIEKMGDAKKSCSSRSIAAPTDVNLNSVQQLGKALMGQGPGHDSLNWNDNGAAVSAYIIPGNKNENTFDLNSWSGTGGQAQYWSVDGSSSENPQFKTKPVVSGN